MHSQMALESSATIFRDAVNPLSYYQIFLYVAAILLPLWAAFQFLDGLGPPQRRYFKYSPITLGARAFNLASLHNQFIMNRAVGCDLAVRSAEESGSSLPAIVRKIDQLSAGTNLEQARSLLPRIGPCSGSHATRHRTVTPHDPSSLCMAPPTHVETENIL